MNRKRIAVDLAKSVFQIAESLVPGQVSRRLRLNRAGFERYLRELEPADLYLEACGTAHHWGRLAQQAGHTVYLLHARHVKAYRLRSKNDRNDADAILEAARCGNLHPVPVKSAHQQHCQQLHALREGWKKTRTQRINQLRGILRELGVDTAASTEAFIQQAQAVVDAPEFAPIAPQLHILLAEIVHLKAWMAEAEQQLARLHQQEEIIQHIDDVSGVGLLTASAFVTAVGTPERFRNGRALSAWVGLTPREHSSGSQRRLGSISRAGNTYLRTLLIHGARSALLAAKRCAARTPDKLTRLQRWAVELSDRVGHNRAAVALANKLARICWAVWRHQRRFNGNFLPELAA